jgi:hypothetical protein
MVFLFESLLGGIEMDLSDQFSPCLLTYITGDIGFVGIGVIGPEISI